MAGRPAAGSVGTLPAVLPADGQARGRSGGRHCTAGQSCYVPLGRHLVFSSSVRRRTPAGRRVSLYAGSSTSELFSVMVGCWCCVGEWDGDAAHRRGAGETDVAAEAQQREPLQQGLRRRRHWAAEAARPGDSHWWCVVGSLGHTSRCMLIGRQRRRSVTPLSTRRFRSIYWRHQTVHWTHLWGLQWKATSKKTTHTFKYGCTNRT